MTNATQVLPRRAVILAHLSKDPGRGLTAHELQQALGMSNSLPKLLRSMQQHAEVIAATEWRPRVGREARLWRIAPPGTVPPPPVPVSPERLARRRQRDTETQRARRARLRELRQPSPGPVSLPHGAACTGADPELFFSPPGSEDEAAAMAICADCPIRAACYAKARETRQAFGIWGGVRFEVTK
jgi:Transcription factor WhiB